MKFKVLVIDTNPLILKCCEMVLRKAGLEVLAAQDVSQGLSLIEAHEDLDSLFLDAHCENPPAPKILRRLQERGIHLPVILLSDREKEAPFCAGEFPFVVGVLPKPFNPASLIKMVQSCQQERDAVVPEHLPSAVNPAIPQACPTPALQGDIALMPLAEILQLLHFQNQTGIFRIQHDASEVCVFFEKGCVQLATSSNLENEYRLGRVLLQRRALPASRLQQALLTQREHMRPLGEALVNEQILLPTLLEAALREQTCRLIYELLRWTTGRFSFEILPALPEIAQRARLDLSVEEVVLEGFRRLDEWKMMEVEVGSLQTVWERTPQSTAVLDRLSPHEKTILENVNGSSTVNELAERLLIPQFEIYKAFHHLVGQKMVQRRSDRSVPPTFNA